jgi:hypothetical protein
VRVWERFIARLEHASVVGDRSAASPVAEVELHDLFAAIWRRPMQKSPRLSRLRAFGAWLVEPEFNVLLPSVRELAALLGDCAMQKLEVRKTAIEAMYYEAPPAKEMARLFAKANLALSRKPANDKAILAGHCVLVIHPMTDGSGRLSRAYWLKGLLQQLTAAQAIHALRLFDGEDSRASLLVKQAATYAGDPAPAIERWKTVISRFE